GPNGLTGTLSLSDHNEAILAARLSPRSVYTGEYESLRRDAAHRALVIVCTGECPGMGLLNAEWFSQSYGAPTIHVSSEVSEAVLAGAARARRRRTRRTRQSSRREPIRSGGCPQRSRRDPWLPAFLSAGGGYDAAQLVVAIDC